MTKAPQTQFWEGQFGDEYTARNRCNPDDRQGFFARILDLTDSVSSICELGANRGHNLEAIGRINSSLELTGVEVNRVACSEMAGKNRINSVCSTIQEFSSTEQFDLVFTCGVMIHLPPEDLKAVYEKMIGLSQRYVMVNEYFNPVPVEIEYRGHPERLFKRDFGGELLDASGGKLRLVDYGFLWQRVEPAWDNTTWWLFEKK